MSDTVNVAIIGVGNCASSLVQGIQYYKDAAPDEFVPGLMHVDLGGYHVRRHRVHGGVRHQRHARSARTSPRRSSPSPTTPSSFADVPHLGVPVHRGMTHDGLGKYLSEVITKADGPTADIAGILRDTNTHVVVSYLPVGSENATKWYVEQILQRRLRVRELHARLHRPRALLAASASRSAASRSWATTSRARSARPSCTASSPASCASAASAWPTRSSSTSAATRTS